MFLEGFFNFLNFILSSSDQPQKFIVFAAAILLVNILIAVIDWKWGRGIGFTVFAILAGAFSAYVSVVFLQGMQRYLEMELTEPESWASLDFYIELVYWYILELPIILGLGIGAVVLAALSRQRGWIIGNAVALALTVHGRDVRMFQAHLAFVVVLLAFQLLYLAYGVWRIWRSRGLGSQSRSRSATPLPSVQS